MNKRDNKHIILTSKNNLFFPFLNGKLLEDLTENNHFSRKTKESYHINTYFNFKIQPGFRNVKKNNLEFTK